MPKVVDHNERRAMIVTAACTVIANDGLDATTIRRIADQADCSSGMVTHYFESRELLLRAALRQVHEIAGNRMLHTIESVPPSDALRAVIEQSLPLDEDRQDEWRVWLAFWGQAATDPELAKEQQDRYREWAALMSDLLDRSEVAVDVDLLIATVDGIGIHATLDAENFPAARQLQIVGTLIGR